MTGKYQPRPLLQRFTKNCTLHKTYFPIPSWTIHPAEPCRMNSGDCTGKQATDYTFLKRKRIRVNTYTFDPQ
ncbi:hypothetical protein ANANG_G00000580 [Anguilla anguilla]|uniref:Uncharacterized protein n=1 Tax=Anguilla anguilla TaxID=7936 RepID=A0A9D3MVX4_ANGAN|nr:hypothetical protein ANANG_G00000580 [Anguilla anguilla]